MQEMFLGEAIKKRRLELGLTQEQLCEGICEPITLSRLENGKQTPSRNRINAILERLDMPADRFYALLSKNELDIDTLQRQIIAYNISFSHALDDEKVQIRNQAIKAHQELASIIDKDDTLSRQLILRSQIILGTSSGDYGFEDKKKMLLEAIRLTAPYFDLDDIGKGLYTTEEIKIINQLALVYVDTGDHMEAINIYNQLYKYIQKHFHNIPLTRAHLNMIAYNYADELNRIGQHEKAIEIAEEGQRICLVYGHYLSLPSLIAIQAECHHFLGNNNKSRDLYCQAYYLMKAVGNDRNLHVVKKKAKNQVGLEFDN